MLWVKAFHIIFMVTWFAGLFYLPRLFVYHALCADQAGNERFKVMERRLFYGIMTPGGVLTLVFGLWLLYDYAWEQYSGTYWMHIKLALAALLVAFHVYCGLLVHDFKHDRNRHSDRYYRWLNEVPTVILIAVVILAVVKPI